MKKRPKLPKSVETKVLARSRRICCLCSALKNDDADKAGQIAHLDNDPSNNDFENLAWLCLDHHGQYSTRSNMTKGFTAQEVKVHRDRLYRMIEDKLLPNTNDRRPQIFPFPSASPTTTGDYSPVITAGRDVNFNVRGGRKAPPLNPPSDAIGSCIKMRSYVEYLVGRYIEWRNKGIKGGIDRRRFFPGIMNNFIKSKFGARANLVPQSRFDDLVEFVQLAIDNTIWGRKNRHRNYHSFDEHCELVRGKRNGNL